jgi:alkylation response protein AidB-like acyl-CoA dehydrogenase
MCRRVKGRVAFGKPVAEQTVTLERIAESRIAIDQARLLVLKAAHRMDTVGNKEARKEIAMIKVAAPGMALRVIDWAIQAHGGAGVCDDFGLAYAWANHAPPGRRPRRVTATRSRRWSCGSTTEGTRDSATGRLPEEPHGPRHRSGRFEEEYHGPEPVHRWPAWRERRARLVAGMAAAEAA